MPLRNFIVIAITALVSFACYSVAAKNRHANLFAEAMSLVEKESLHPLPPDRLLDAAMEGMLEKVDEYSRFFNSAEYREFKEGLKQEFSGIGVNIMSMPETNQLIVLNTLPDSPAFKAGLQIGDEIISVDGREVAAVSRNEAIRWIKGPTGSSVELTLARNGEVMNVSVVRGKIRMESTFGDFRLPNGKPQFVLQDYPKIGYIRVEQFSEKTASEFKQAIEQHQDEIDGLIIDLRNNGGGLLEVAVEICDFFLEKGKLIVSTRGRGDRIVDTLSVRQPILPVDLPVVVLMNRFSASASEIVAGCLQDHQRAVIIGEQSFGKGTVQNLIPMQYGQSAIKLTTASYWRPSGQPIDRKDANVQELKNWGVMPNEDFSIEMSEKEVFQVTLHRSLREMSNLVGPDNKEILSTIQRVRSLAYQAFTNDRNQDRSPMPDDDQEDELELLNEQWEDAVLNRALEFLKPFMGARKKAA